jgi:lysozyme
MNLVEQLARDEGRRARMYQDTVGKWTAGVGRNLSDVPFSDDEIDLMLANDIERVRTQLAPFAWYQALDEIRKGAVENMCFNLGVHGLLGFPHMLAALAAQDWVRAANEMANSVWATQVGERAIRLQQQITTGEWV